MRLVDRMEHDIIKDIVKKTRSEGISPTMRLVADEIAQERLKEEHNIEVSLQFIRKIA